VATANAGRTPRPAPLKLVQGRGNGKDSGGRAVKTPPAFKRLPPKAPSWLGRVAKAEWRRILPELTRLDLVKEIDASALAAYCEMVQTFVVATREVHASGLTVENHSTRKDGSESTWLTANPAVGAQLKSQAAIRAWCAEFGLTPSAEMRLGKTGDDGDEESNPFAQ
jgi:P27 family predicted phage terminase small subunit